MREAHARNPQLRHSAAGQKKKCGHCGQEGHNRRACPQLLAAAQAMGERVRGTEDAKKAGKAGQPAQSKGAGAAVPAGKAAGEEAGQPPAPSRVIVIEELDTSPTPAQGSAAQKAAGAAAATQPDVLQGASSASSPPTSSSESLPRAPAAPGGAASPALPSRALPTVAMAPGMSLCPEGSWVFSLPQSKEECVAQAAQVGAAGPRGRGVPGP